MTKTVESPSIPATQTDDTIPSPSEFDAAVSAARQVSVTVGRYRQEVSALNTRIRTLESEREVHMAKLLPPSDFINFLDEYVDRRAEEGRAVLRSQVSAIVHPERYGSSPKGGTWPVMSYGDVAAALGQDSATLAKWLHDHLPLRRCPWSRQCDPGEVAA